MTNVATEKKLASLKEGGSGELLLSGVLDYSTGKQLYMMGNSIISHCSANELILDGTGITRTSSVGLSLVLSLIRDAERVGKKLIIRSLPVELQEIAKFSGVLDILPLATDFEVIDEKER